MTKPGLRALNAHDWPRLYYVASIACGACGDDAEVDMPEAECNTAMDHFSKEGWRVDERHRRLLCPTCAGTQEPAP